MSEQEDIFSTVRFHKTAGLLKQVRPEETLGSRKAHRRECSVPWQLIVITLGILCSLRLIIVAVLMTNIFQCSQEKLQETLINLHHNYSSMRNESYLKEEMRANKSIECDSYKNLLYTLNRQQNRCHGETKIVLDCLEHRGKHVDGHWFCCGIKCYYFIMDTKHWKGCKQICQDCSLSLLKIDDEDELKFLQLQVTPDSYWIGLKYDNIKQEWAWIDNGPSKLALNITKYSAKGGECMFLTKTRLENSKCDNQHPCVCEKRLDMFPDCLTNKI